MVILPIGRPGPQAMYEANSSVEVLVLKPAKELGDVEKVRAMVHADGTGEARLLKRRETTAGYGHRISMHFSC